MKTMSTKSCISLVVLLLTLSAFNGTRYYPSSFKVSRKDGKYFCRKHLGEFSYAYEPQLYYKSNDTFHLTGFVYEVSSKVSPKFDSLLIGVEGVKFFSGYLINEKNNNDEIIKINAFLGQSNCIGKFQIDFVPIDSLYIVAEKDTGFSVAINSLLISKIEPKNQLENIYKEPKLNSK